MAGKTRNPIHVRLAMVVHTGRPYRIFGMVEMKDTRHQALRIRPSIDSRTVCRFAQPI